ncbi:MAG TPA: protein kinase [Bryobacteraceae bacterium]|nr:protein kinase [Bryobacteraceae bacterium]
MSFPFAEAVSPGECILHYQIEQRLGAGGMGVVYRALDLKLKRRVALKFLPPGLGTDLTSRERLLREAMAASALDHPNMGAVHAIEDAGGRTFIVMAYYEGETLKDRLDRGPLPPSQAINIALQAARGLAKAHECGIIHRDIKPSNLIVTRDGTVKIVDFGLARISGTDSLTKTGTTMGTAAYMSPEQAVHSEMDCRTDLWSLGVVLYEMLRGDVPFHGESAVGVLFAVVHQPPDPPTGIPPRIAAVVDKCLRKPPAERYRTAAELIADLERLSSGADERASTVTIPPAKPVEARRRQPIVLAVCAAVVLLGVVLAGLALSRKSGSAPAQVATVPPPIAAAPSARKSEPPAESAAAKSTPVSKAETPPPAVKLPPLRRALSAAEYGGPSHGELQWTGKLPDHETLTIQAGHVVHGSLSDDLPLVPITIEVTPPGLSIVEPPSTRNQWDRLVVRNDAGRTLTEITVRWKLRP